MAKCNNCGNSPAPNEQYIIRGTYYRNLCNPCYQELSDNPVSSGDARWQRTLDAEDHEAEIQQPYNADGSINTRFAKLYPRQAQQLFTSEELDKANRK